jgi:hypothetical protein
LHQGLATADGQPAFHGAQSVPIFADHFDGPRESDGHAIGHFPSVRIVAINAAELAAGEPGNDTNSGAVDSGASGERMDEAELTAFEPGANVDFVNALTEPDAQIVLAGDEWRFG